MRGQFNLRLADNPRLRIRVLHLPYKRSDVGFYIILPYDIKVDSFSRIIAIINFVGLLL